MSTLIKQALDLAERKGFTVSRHPNGTGIIRNFREYMLLFPQQDGSVHYEVREPLYPAHTLGHTEEETEIHGVVEGLK